MEESKKIILVGAGGHCLSVIDSLLSSYTYQAIGIVDNVYKDGQRNTYQKKFSVMGIPIIGCDNDLERLHKEGYNEAFICVGSIGDTTTRKRLYQLIKNIGFSIPNVIDKSSMIGRQVSMGEGIYIGKNVVINPLTNIGNLAIINTSATIEHGCNIGNFTHIAPRTILCGNVKVGESSHVGAGSAIKQGIRVGHSAMIGMGSVVITNIGDNVIAYGNPCEEVKYE